MRYLLLLPIVLALQSCVATAEDLRQIADSVAQVEAKMADEYATQGEVEQAFGDMGRTIGQVADRVDERLESGILTVEDGLKGGGLLSLLTGIGLNMYRNSQRRRRGEPVTEAEAARQS